MNVVCIVQARVGSTRLPAKVLKKICGKTVLEHDINRLSDVKNINKIVIATTTLENDDLIVEEASRIGVACFRGSEEDVLSRYYHAAKEHNADVVVRVTSDCPLIDSKVTQDIIEFFLLNLDKYDYVSNTIDRTYPRGLDTEVFSFKSLEKAFSEAVQLRDREHVTPYIWSNKQLFRNYQYKNNNDYSNLRWTLDTEEDLTLIKDIYNYLYKTNEKFLMDDILDLYNKHPELNFINNDIEQKKI